MKARYSTAVYVAISALFLISVPALADVSDHVKSACKGDYQRYCKAYKVGTEGLRACMSRSIKRVSNVCISALVKNGDMSQAQADRVKAQKASSEASDDQAHNDEKAHHHQNHVAQEAVSLAVERCTGECLEEWVRLRRALWPHASEQELRLEAAAILERPHDQIAFIARGENLAVVAFAEATLRRDYVNGCTTSPVGFLEGLYVDPAWRHRGIARKLCRAVEDWAASLRLL